MVRSFKNQVVFFPGGAFYLGRGIQTHMHSHNATEVVLSFNKSFSIKGTDGLEDKFKCALIRKDIKHQFTADKDDWQLFLYFDALHEYTISLEQGLLKNRAIMRMDSKLTKSFIANLLSLIEYDIRPKELINLFITAGIIPKSSGLKHKDERIVKAIPIIAECFNSEINLSKIAFKVHLSESRFSHLFTEQIGIPFKRYVLWYRLQKAIEFVLMNYSLTQAAHASGFSDSAHFTRTFVKMFGATPSLILKD